MITALAWAFGGFRPDALKALLLREATQDTSTSTVKTKEPSSIDFQNLFAEIASCLLSNPSRRLVIVIDNLDRIDAADAVTMWATMRVFFDASPNPPQWQKRVWLIVPFDRTALAGLWQSADGKGGDFVDSFLNKTFQIAFHVSPPVLTTWKLYFQKCLEMLTRAYMAALMLHLQLTRCKADDKLVHMLIELGTCTARTISVGLGHAGAPDCRPRAAFSSVEEGE